MDKHEIDDHLKKTIKASNDFYYADAEIAKDRIWNKVKTKKAATPLFYRLLAAASVLLLLLLSSSLYFNLNYKSTINDLVETNKQITIDNQNLAAKTKSANASNKPIVDTVFIVKKPNAQPALATKYIKDTIYIKEFVYIEKESTLKSNSDKAIASTTENKTKADQNRIAEENSKTVAFVESLSPEKVEESVAMASNSKSKEEVAIQTITPEKEDLKVEASIDIASNTIQKDIIIKTDKGSKQKNRKKFKLRFGRNNSKIGSETLALSTKISK